ncbi:MAG: PE family protein [Mycobacterium pseudokansasii]|uniref:PE family protein n=1 Tax=Mycobacterium pseudokansasii TaxID=2341080 RepID=UPI000F01AAE9|nr:PE family protein [Mycobacterium pseudokansasii]
MSFLIAAPTELAHAAADLSLLPLRSVRPTRPLSPRPRPVVAAAADEVSAQIAALFAHHGQSYQAVSAQAAGSRTVP